MQNRPFGFIDSNIIWLHWFLLEINTTDS